MEYEKSIGKHNVFEDLTTYRNDYRKYVGLEKALKLAQPQEVEDAPVKIPQLPPIKDPETLVSMRDDACVPFNLFWEERPIVGTDPRSGFTPQRKLEDTGKGEAIKTRPRLYMSPAVSVDDVPDEKMRELLIRYMYTTDWRKYEREAAGAILQREVPMTTLETNQELGYKPESEPPPPVGWREKGAEWDAGQNRASVDPTRSYWLNWKINPRCEDTEDPLKKMVPMEVKQEIDTLIRNDELRAAHDLHCSTYTGYRPRNANGVPLKKVHFPVTHPLLTVSQARAERCAQPDQPFEKSSPVKKIC